MTQTIPSQDWQGARGQAHGADGPIAIDQLLARVIGLSATAFARRQMTLRASIPSDLPLIWGSQIQLRQLFLSLLALSSEVAHPGATICLSAQPLAEPSLSYDDRPAVLISLSFLPAAATEPHAPPPASALNRDLAFCAQIVAEHGGRLTHHAYRRYTMTLPAYKGNPA